MNAPNPAVSGTGLQKAAQTLVLPIEGMSCASCVRRVEMALGKVPGVASVNVNLATERATVTLAEPLETQQLVQAVQKMGYDVPESTVVLQVDEMSCASCVGRVERALKAVPGVRSASVNLATERATVSGLAPVAALLAAAEKAGYPARVVDGGEDPASAPGAAGDGADAHGDGISKEAGTHSVVDRKAAEQRALWRDLWLAAALALPVFLLEMGGHMVPAFHHWVAHTIGTQNSWYLQFVLTTLVLFVPGLRFYRKGIPALLRGAPDMNSLVAVGTLAAWGFSTVAT
ncbi:MAG: copper ion binding protein, partial [Lautropia mirabilis]|nr:copper ion binding protein [Lautropia mirabilis]